MSELLKFKLLPASLINTNFVQGNPNSNYEKYLLEFVNASPFFLKKSKGQVYTAPESEHCGQCDCISDHYTLDFKMIVSPTMAQAKNLFTQSICQPCAGVTMYGDAKIKPSDKGYRPIEATVLHTWLRDLSVDELYHISLSDNFSIPAYKDIKSILGAINKPKNIICMLPYEYVCEEQDDIESKKKEVIKTISADYRSLADYRMKVQPEFDNYVVFVFEKNLFILQFNKSSAAVVDIIPITKSKIFCQLRNAAKAF